MISMECMVAFEKQNFRHTGKLANDVRRQPS